MNATAPPTEITVVIPVYGPGPHLSRVIGALKRQQPPVTRIIISHSGHGNLSLVAGNDPDILVLHSYERLFAGAARNRGLQLVNTEWVAFIDEDVIVDQHWHESLLRSISLRNADCFVGSVGYADSGGYWGMSRWFLEFSPAHPFLRPSIVSTCGAGNIAIRAEPFRSMGAFPEDWRMSEDVLALATFSKTTGTIRFQPEIVARHINVPGMRRMIQHIYQFGRWTAKVRRAHPELSGSTAVRWPLLSLGLWAARIAQIYGRVLGSRKGPFLSLLFHTPGILVGLIAWNAGFSREAFHATDSRTIY